MKQKNYNLIFFLILISYFSLISFAQDIKENKDFLAGSIVKSDNWEIDRNKNIEIFNGNVSFRNSLNIMKSNYAIYNHNDATWIANDNVYFKRLLDNNSYIESFCENAIYYKKLEKAQMFSKKENVKSIYHLKDSKDIISLSPKILALNNEKKIYFEEALTIYTDSATITGNNGFYDYPNREFIILGGPPFLIAKNESYDIFFEAKKIKLNSEDKRITALKDVKGTILINRGH